MRLRWVSIAQRACADHACNAHRSRVYQRDCEFDGCLEGRLVESHRIVLDNVRDWVASLLHLAGRTRGARLRDCHVPELRNGQEYSARTGARLLGIWSRRSLEEQEQAIHRASKNH